VYPRELLLVLVPLSFLPPPRLVPLHKDRPPPSLRQRRKLRLLPRQQPKPVPHPQPPSRQLQTLLSIPMEMVLSKVKPLVCPLFPPRFIADEQTTTLMSDMVCPHQRSLECTLTGRILWSMAQELGTYGRPFPGINGQLARIQRFKPKQQPNLWSEITAQLYVSLPLSYHKKTWGQEADRQIKERP
jgi:hypothetical protein